MPSDQTQALPETFADTGRSPVRRSQLRTRLRRQTDATLEPGLQVSVTIASEFLTTALFAAVTTSIVNARAEGRKLRLASEISMYLPKPPQAFGGAMVADDAPFFDHKLTGYLRRIYQHLDLALQVTPRATNVWMNDNPSSCLSWKELANVWLPLCGEMRLMLLTLTEFNMLRHSEHLPRLLEIEALTKSARYGGTPCIRSDGFVFVPGWLDHRRDRRVPIGITVTIDYGAGPHRVTLSDISSSGVGLTLCPSLRPGCSISIQLPNNQVLGGTAQWSNGGSVGVLLTEPLIETDPLFRFILGLRRVADKEPSS
jgi:PilZ domain